MPHSVTLISTIAAGLGLALVFGFIAARIKLPPLVGYLIAGIKDVSEAKVGDTVTHRGKLQAQEPLPGYREPKPMVFAGIYPTDPEDYPDLRDALQAAQRSFKLRKADAADPEFEQNGLVEVPGTPPV